MNELIVRTNPPEPEAVEPAGLKIGQWIGRREAFSLIAGRCSAADIQAICEIRDRKLYRELNCSWEECCTRYLHTSRRSVDREIHYLKKFGPAFFTLRQITHISVKEYESIAGHVSEQGVHLDGRLIAIGTQNSEQVASAVAELLQRVPVAEEAAPPDPVPEPFDALLERCRAVAEDLKAFDGDLDASQRLALGAAVAAIRASAAGAGAVVWDRR